MTASDPLTRHDPFPDRVPPLTKPQGPCGEAFHTNLYLMKLIFSRHLLASLTALCLSQPALFAATLTPLGYLPGGGSFSVAQGVSADGSTVVGYGNSANGPAEPFR